MPPQTQDALIADGEKVGVKYPEDLNEDIRSLRELLIYGIKGIAAYADHARILGKTDDAIDAFIHEAMAALDTSLTADDYGIW